MLCLRDDRGAVPTGVWVAAGFFAAGAALHLGATMHDLQPYEPGPRMPELERRYGRALVRLNRNEDLFPPFPGMREASTGTSFTIASEVTFAPPSSQEDRIMASLEARRPCACHRGSSPTHRYRGSWRMARLASSARCGLSDRPA